MKFFILLFISIQAYAYNPMGQSHYFPEQIVGERKCNLDADGRSTCNFTDCKTNEIWNSYNGSCLEIDCSRNPYTPIQNENLCTKHPTCTGAPYEHLTPDGSCVHCPPPTIFGSTQCEECVPPSVFNPDTEQCQQPTTCADGYELPHPASTMCYPKCAPDSEMDVFGQCHKKYKPAPICPKDHKVVNGQCVPVPKPVECNGSLKDSIDCLKNDVTTKINQTNNETGGILSEIKNILFNLKNNLLNDNDNNEQGDNENTNNPTYPNQQEQPDTSQFESQTPFKEFDNSTNFFLNESLFINESQCPSNKTFSIWSTNFNFSYETICEWFSKLSYIIMAISYLLSISIILKE